MTAPAGKMRWPVRTLSRDSGDTRTRRSGENWAIVAGRSLLRPSAHSLQAPMGDRDFQVQGREEAGQGLYKVLQGGLRREESVGGPLCRGVVAVLFVDDRR